MTGTKAERINMKLLPQNVSTEPVFPSFVNLVQSQSYVSGVGLLAYLTNAVNRNP
jgi:hypothetical protein